MNRMTKIAAAMALGGFLVSPLAFSNEPIEMTIGVNILDPEVNITREASLNFGSFYITAQGTINVPGTSGAAAGNFEPIPATHGDGYIGHEGNASAGHFKIVNGPTPFSSTLTLPTLPIELQLKGTGNSSTMQVTALTVRSETTPIPPGGNITANPGETINVYIGGTLSFDTPANQANGEYEATVSFTFNY